MILIVSTVADIATDAVVRSLLSHGAPHRRINTEDFPFSHSLTVDYQAPAPPILAFQQRVTKPSTICYRRLRSPVAPDELETGVYDFCLRENRSALLGGLMTHRVRWMSHPEKVWRAEFKPYQLSVAKELGLTIPKTIVSNDPDAIRAAYRDFGSLIVKPARSGHFWRKGEEFSVFTSRIDEEHLASLDQARWTPSIYQELIAKQCDIRTTYVGGCLFSAAIHSQTDPAAEVDWRKTANPSLPHSTIQLPPPIETKLHELMQRLELTFGCIDLVLTPSGDYVFLEVNPSGQWLWLDDQLELGITDAIAWWLGGNSP
jgi:glutathione synthase/RimK-type ligase-like ATP-grasp enzyme